MNRTSGDNSKFVRITAIENAIEGQLISSVLTERDIPHQIQSFHDIAFDGLFQSQKGWGKLMAPPAFEEEILEIVSDLRSGPPPGISE